MNIIGVSGLHNSVSFKKKELPGLSAREYRIAQGFDAAAALAAGGEIVAAAAEERFTGEKKTGAFPVNAIRYCLRAGGLDPGDVDYFAHGFSYEPFKSFYEYSSFGVKQFNEVYSRDALVREIREHFPGYGWSGKLTRVQHHLAHAASAFYLSGFDESLILVTDGMGEIHSATAAVGKGNDIEIVKQISSAHSAGILYGVITLHLGFYMGMDEFKVMGLAPYGNPRRYFGKLMEYVDFKDDGTYSIPLLFENKTLVEKETYRGTLAVLAELFGPPREPGAGIDQNHKDIAAALQAVLQACQMHTLRHFKRETGLRNLCMAGGVALNCTANGAIHRSRMFDHIFIQPAASDDGAALGAALFVQHQHAPGARSGKMGLPLWGPAFDAEAVAHVLDRCDACESVLFDSFDALAADAAGRIEKGQVVAWFQGRMEFGPRALGNRSILADPRDPGMRDHVNGLVKKREGFRPFAPAVTEEEASRFFEIGEGEESLYAYMLYVTRVQAEYREKLPAITHVDGSARVQTVSKKENPKFWTLLDKFRELSGMSVVLNTSFNLQGQPIVCTPTEAVETFLASGIDALAIGNYMVTRN
ncbi:MAG: carbamoyltransferase [Desulfobacterales bacterium]|nr:carbamoyltransferase [Desulfobacterales bacterium]